MTRMSVMLAMLFLATGQPTVAPASTTPTVPPLPNEGPVTKVVNLLKRMQDQISEEKAKDEEIYEKLQCWCDTNRKEKTAAVKEAQETISKLTADIEEYAAKIGGLKADLTQLKKEVAANTEALNEATAMREKEAAEFAAEEKEMLEAIDALTGAVDVLSKHNGGDTTAALMSVKAAVSKHQSTSGVSNLMNLLEQPAGYNSYNSRSGEIFGILSQMKETFETNLAASRADEAKDIKAFEELKAAKEEQIAKARAQIVEKTELLAATETAQVQAKADLKDTRESLSADEQFILDLEERCDLSDKEWAERSKTRADELVAVGKAISILTDDSARDLFSSTYSFIQTGDSTRKAVAEVLQKAAVKTKSAELSRLASSAQLDAFTKVKAAIDEMLAELKKQQQEEAEHRDWCEEELRVNKKQTWAMDNQKEDLTAQIASLTEEIETLTEEIKNLGAEMAEMKVQLKRASEDREAENKDFQQVVADQRATVTILDKALQKLRAFYEPEAVAQEQAEKAAAAATPVLLQRQEPPPAGFTPYKTNENAGGVLGLIQMTINDAKRMETDALKAEQDSQSAYVAFVKDTKTGLTARGRSVTEKSKAKGDKEVEKAEAESSLEMTLTDLEKLAKYASEVHSACDYVTKNYDIRQEARKSEMDALTDAKAILSGASFQ